MSHWLTATKQLEFGWSELGILHTAYHACLLFDSLYISAEVMS